MIFALPLIQRVTTTFSFCQFSQFLLSCFWSFKNKPIRLVKQVSQAAHNDKTCVYYCSFCYYLNYYSYHYHYTKTAVPSANPIIIIRLADKQVRSEAFVAHL